MEGRARGMWLMGWLFFGMVMVGLFFLPTAKAGGEVPGFECIGYCGGTEPYVEGFWNGRMELNSVDVQLNETSDSFNVFFLAGDTQKVTYPCPPEYPDCQPYTETWADMQIFLDKKLSKRFGSGRIELNWTGNKAVGITINVDGADPGQGSIYCRMFYGGNKMKGLCNSDTWQSTPENPWGEPMEFMSGKISLKR
ncbi:MAG: hypothetical protein V1845_00225 [bacterium]